MTPPSPLLTHIGFAEVHIVNARRTRNPLSVSGCFECSAHLDQAIQEMKAACEVAAAAPVPAGARARLDRLREDVESLSRLVDAAIAFGRGCPLQTSGGPLIDSEVRG